MTCLVKNSKGTAALCCSIGEPNCFVSEHPEGHFRVSGGNNASCMAMSSSNVFVVFLFQHTFPSVCTGRSHFTWFLFAQFCFNIIWHRQYVIFFGLSRFGIDDPLHHLCWRVAESDVTVTPSIMCVDWLLWWYNHVTDLVPCSMALAFVTKMSEKCKSTSCSAIQVKNRQKTVSIKEKLDAISQF
jgi:hypothetical protein